MEMASKTRRDVDWPYCSGWKRGDNTYLGARELGGVLRVGLAVVVHVAGLAPVVAVLAPMDEVREEV